MNWAKGDATSSAFLFDAVIAGGSNLLQQQAAESSP